MLPNDRISVKLKPHDGAGGRDMASPYPFLPFGTSKCDLAVRSLQSWIDPATRRRFVEPAAGIEPATYCLQNSCSAAELRRHGGLPNSMNQLFFLRPRPSLYLKFPSPCVQFRWL